VSDWYRILHCVARLLILELLLLFLASETANRFVKPVIQKCRLKRGKIEEAKSSADAEMSVRMLCQAGLPMSVCDKYVRTSLVSDVPELMTSVPV
jgi:hypothetical protein